MATFVGTVGKVDYYADTTFIGWGLRGSQITVQTWANQKPTVWVTDLGKVKTHDEAVDRVVATVRRERELEALKGEETNG